MCLGIPGRVTGWADEAAHLARVDVAGVTRTVNLGLVRDDGVGPGDWVLIHVGFALSVVDEHEAAAALATLRRLGTPFDDEMADLARSRIE